jgi:integrase
MQVQQNVIDPLFERKVDLITEGLAAGYAKRLKLVSQVSQDNALTICNYIMAMKTEINSSDSYRRTNIAILTKLSKFFRNQKSFNQIRREDVLSFLDILRKPESLDPLHKWVGTYNLHRVQLIRFFKWLYYPDIESGKRPKPLAVENIPQLKRNEQSIYKPSDLWTAEDDLLFLKYCPSKRDRCYHAISRDLSCRPHEILKLKIKDIAFKLQALINMLMLWLTAKQVLDLSPLSIQFLI